MEDKRVTELEEKTRQLDSRLKEVEAYIDAFKKHNERIHQALEHWGK